MKTFLSVVVLCTIFAGCSDGDISVSGQDADEAPLPIDTNAGVSDHSSSTSDAVGSEHMPPCAFAKCNDPLAHRRRLSHPPGSMHPAMKK